MSTARIVDWASTFRDIPPGCDPCEWRGPFPRSERMWQLPEANGDPRCKVHGDQPAPVPAPDPDAEAIIHAARVDARDLAALRRLIRDNPALVRAQMDGAAT